MSGFWLPPLDGWQQVALEELGAMVRSLRATRGVSQRALASRCGLNQSTISRLENGLAPGLRLGWLARILASLDFDDGLQRSRSDRRPPPSWPFLHEAFGTRGRLSQRMREAEIERLERLDRMMQR